MLFNFYTMVASAWTVIGAAVEGFQCSQIYNDECHLFTNIAVTALCFVTGLLAGVFTLFTLVMFQD